MEIPLLIVALTIIGFILSLVRVKNTKQDKLDKDVENAYKHLRDYILDPILKEIIGGKRGRYKTDEFFDTPEVIRKLDEYRKQLFKFNKISEEKGSIMLMWDLSLNTAIGIVVVSALFMGITELLVNSTYNTFGINMSQIIIFEIILLLILILFLAGFIKKYQSINSSFKKQITELKGGLP